jgi:hypothetical protein
VTTFTRSDIIYFNAVEYSGGDTLPDMQKMQPCARCEQELPEAFFDNSTAMFCKRCTHEINDILRKKYSIIEAAHFRAQLRHTSRHIQQKRIPAVAAAAGD